MILLASVSVAFAASLKIEVTGLASDDGDVHVALYDSAEKFPDSDGMIAERIITISNRTAETDFPNLVPGRYAVAVYHDENGNHDFDQGLFGIPLESYGFSNGAKAFLGPPSFFDAAVDVGEPETRIVIDLGG